LRVERNGEREGMEEMERGNRGNGKRERGRKEGKRHVYVTSNCCSHMESSEVM